MIDPGFNTETELFALFALTISIMAIFGLLSVLWAIYKGRKTLSMKTWVIFYLLGIFYFMYLWTDEEIIFSIFQALHLSFFASLTMVGLVACRLRRLYIFPPLLAGLFWIGALTLISESKLEGFPFWLATFMTACLAVLGFFSFFIFANRHKTPSAFIETVGFIIFLLGEFLFLLHYVSESILLVIAGFAELLGMLCFVTVIIGLFEATTWRDLEIGRF